MTPWLALFTATVVTPSTSCVTVAGDWILAGDMLQSVPVFAAIPAETVLGNAPVPGSRRAYGSSELSRLARRYGLSLEPGVEACFTRPLETLTRERVAAALQEAMPGAHLDLLDFSHQPVPPGDLRFSPATSGSSEQTWRGTVSRTGQAGFPVWVKVRVQASGMRAVAAEKLAPGQPIARSQLRLEQGPPGIADASQIVGRAPRRLIAAGTPIQAQWLEDPAEVLSGEGVEVEVRSGPARLLLEGRAQAAGRKGQVIPVRNPANGKVFHAIVREHGRVMLVAGPPQDVALGVVP